MKSIAHISDLHFGTEDIGIANELLNDINSLEPDLVVISGDLTQRARTSQYRSAAAYIKKFKSSVLTVPGNHDVPLFDIFRRFFSPLTRYNKYINKDVDVFYSDDEMAVLGLNTARSFTWKNGRLSVEQIELIRTKLCSINMPLIEVIVVHHQFIPPSKENKVALLGRAELALKTISECGVDLILAGHLHEGFTGDVLTYYPNMNRSVIVAQAGTAISQRRRGEPNAYNYIYLSKDFISIKVRVWNGSSFAETKQINYKCSAEKKWVQQNISII
jgi:3',5'-cyclic AMP phosphodiesterase CpdA